MSPLAGTYRADDVRILLAKKHLRIHEAAVLLKRAPRTIQGYLDQGTLTAIRLPSGHRRVVNDERLRAYL